MTYATSTPAAASTPWFRTGLWGALVVLLTTIHHAYGAAIYATPWRLHIVYVAVPVATAFIGALWFASGRRGSAAGRAAGWVGALLVLVFSAVLIGFNEGGYNHLVKNIVYFGFGPEAVAPLFPEGIYELPNDLFFEITGIAQFPAGIMAAIASVRLLLGSSR